MQTSTNTFASLPQDLILDIARDCLLPKTNKLEIREYPHSNQVNFDLVAVDSRGRAALLEILRREVLYIEVKYHECGHISNIDPRQNEEDVRHLLGEGTHPNLAEVFGEPAWHPALHLKQAGHLVHALQINVRCSHACRNTRGHTVAFLPAHDYHILALCPILQRMQKPAGPELETSFIEIVSDGIDGTYPQIRQQTNRAIDLIQHILPAAYHGTLTEAHTPQMHANIENYYGSGITGDGWPIMEPFLKRYLRELETSIESGTPVHELAGLAESFLNNKLLPSFGNHGMDRDLSNEQFLSILSVFNKYQCIFMDGLAEYLLRRQATINGQTHSVLSAICDEHHFLWTFFNRTMGTTVRWASRIVENYTNPKNSTKPSQGNVSLFLQGCAVLLADSHLRFAMARARRSQPSLHIHQPLAYIAQMATPEDPETGTGLLIGQQIENCNDRIRHLVGLIKKVKEDHKLDTEGLNAMWAKAEELLTIISLEACQAPYFLDDWLGVIDIDTRPVLTIPSKYELIQVKPTKEVLSLIDDLRRRNLFQALFW